jgi:thiol-disulfide isomerase/thioredoxin
LLLALAGLLLTGCGSAPDDGAAGRHAEAAAQPAGPAALDRCPAGRPGSGQPDAGQPGAGQPGSGLELPELTLPCLGAGDPVPLRQLAGTPAVLNLWASWCAPCRAELPAFQQAYAAAGGRLRVLGVATEDPPDRALALAADAGLHFASVVDETGKLRRALRRSALPVTVLVGADGRVAQVYAGPPLSYADLRRLVRAELGVALP